MDECNSNSKKAKGRKWSLESMTMAYKAVKSGKLSIAAAAKRHGLPRTSLSDRVKGRVKLNSRWGNETALSTEEEKSLVQYIEFMANRGFPLTVGQIMGFAWCIAREHGKDEVFKKKGPSRKWWRGFKRRHPQLRLRRQDSLDRGRASMGNIDSLREYFQLLNETLDANDLHQKPHLIFNCDEAAINLNKSAGLKVVVPSHQKHVHSVAMATNEHITMHCCVSASGATIPPMVIFSKTFPGGAYHKKGPLNATYAVSDTGFMDGQLYVQWFNKTFLRFVPSERPLLLIQDGASSHVSCKLIQSAIANDVILLCLPPKTTHITQPLDVAVYRKLKIEAAKAMSQAKLVKSDLWVSKKNITSMLRVIYENSFTMNCITEGFRKCGIHPFDPNAVDKSLLLRSCDTVNEEDIDLSVNSNTIDNASMETSTLSTVPVATSSPKQEESLMIADGVVNGEDSAIFEAMTFIVGEDGILSLDVESTIDEKTEADHEGAQSETNCPAGLALAAVESTLTPKKKRKYRECLNFNVDQPDDKIYQTWKKLKTQYENEIAEDNQTPDYIATKVKNSPARNDESNRSEQKKNNVHPLVKAGLITEDLADILVTPSFGPKASAKSTKKRARILTTEEVEAELIEKEKQKKEKEERTKKMKEERVVKRIERSIAAAKRKDDMQKKKEVREQIKAEKEKIKKERMEARETKRKRTAMTRGIEENRQTGCETNDNVAHVAKESQVVSNGDAIEDNVTIMM